jgi:hypothetical protein
MRLPLGCIAVPLLAALAFAADADEPLRSGPQVGKSVPGSFDVRNCNGPDVGETNCLV